MNILVGSGSDSKSQCLVWVFLCVEITGKSWSITCKCVNNCEIAPHHLYMQSEPHLSAMEHEETCLGFIFKGMVVEVCM